MYPNLGEMTMNYYSLKSIEIFRQQILTPSDLSKTNELFIFGTHPVNHVILIYRTMESNMKHKTVRLLPYSFA
jgi:hypothetical protein